MTCSNPSLCHGSSLFHADAKKLRRIFYSAGASPLASSPCFHAGADSTSAVIFCSDYFSAIYQAYAPLIALNNEQNWSPLTVNQKATMLELLRISSYVPFYVFSVQILREGEILRKIIKVVVWLAIAIAFLAIIQKFTSPHATYRFRQTPLNSGTVSPWIYHNHYAGFMEMLIPLVLAVFLFYCPQVHCRESLRTRLVSLFSLLGSKLHFFLSFGVILILASLCIALSWGGMIIMTLGLLFFTLLMTKRSGELFVCYK